MSLFAKIVRVKTKAMISTSFNVEEITCWTLLPDKPGFVDSRSEMAFEENGEQKQLNHFLTVLQNKLHKKR